MEKVNSNIEEKIQTANPVYLEIIEILKSGGEKIKKDLRKSRRVRFCYVAQMAREHLTQTLDSIPEFPRLRHVRILASAIQNVIYQVIATQDDFDSEELMHIREYAEDLLEEVKEIIKKYKSGGMPMGK